MQVRSFTDLLDSVLTQPTAPFRESWTKQACISFCLDRRLPFCEDEVGNLWVGASSMPKVKKSSLVFVAHLDHPGIVISKFSQTQSGKIVAEGKWLGGGPMDLRKCDVKVFADSSTLVVLDGVVRSHTKGPRGADKVIIDIKPSALARQACTAKGLESLGPWGACLWYQKQGAPTGIKNVRGLLVTKAADDLVGACALLQAYANVFGAKGKKSGQKNNGTVLLLSRAEESGFHGTIDVLKRGILNPRKTHMISVETSSALPGAEVNLGPVVRLGDRATVFDSALVAWVQSIAAGVKLRDKKFLFQRRVMDGGSCEATAFNLYGFRVAGLSTPLLNYHNIVQGSEKPAPEAVSLIDVEKLVVLTEAIMRAHSPKLIGALEDTAFGALKKNLLANQAAHEKYFGE